MSVSYGMGSEIVVDDKEVETLELGFQVINSCLRMRRSMRRSRT